MSFGAPSVNEQIQALLLSTTADTGTLASGDNLQVLGVTVKKSYLLPAALGGVALLGLLVWALRRKKTAVAGYRRRR